jgi:HPt (histidine-containing phosphotransfer) domain-containing protein
MKDSDPHDQLTERTRDRLVPVQALVRDVGVEIARIRESTAVLAAPDTEEWGRIQRLAHSIAGRAQALNLGVLAGCARELERFAAAITAGNAKDRAGALQGAAIAIETIDLELSALSNTERLA